MSVSSKLSKLLENRLLTKFFTVLGISLGLSVLAYFWYPIVKAYYTVQPTKGIDFYFTVSNVAHLAKNFASPMTSWWEQWYGGRPFEQVYPVLHFYLIYPLTLLGSVFWAVKTYVVLTLSAFAILCYLLYYKASRNILVALPGCLLTVFSYALYLSPFWGGNVPYTATMFFLPLCLWAAFSYFESGNSKRLLLAGLLTGLAMLGHPQLAVAWIIPLVSIFVWFAKKEVKGFWSALWPRFRDLVIYYSVVVITGLRQLASPGLEGIFNLLKGIFGGRLTGTAAEVANHPETEVAQEMMRQRTFTVKTQEVFEKAPAWLSEPLPFLLMLAGGVFIVFFIFSKNKKRMAVNVLVGGLFLFYGFIFAYLFLMGINPFAGGWLRAYWGLAVIISLIISWFLGSALRNLRQYLLVRGQKKLTAVFLEASLSGAVFLLVVLLTVPVVEGFVTHILTREHEFPGSVGILHQHAQDSSAYPTAVSLNKDVWGEDMFKKLVPDWLDANQLDYRLFDLDGTVNIWWNTHFDMPLARGYIDSQSGSNYSGWQYLANIVMGKDEIVVKYGLPAETARKQAEFFLDWNAIGFLEGVGGAIGRDYGAPFSSYLIDDEMIERSERIDLWRPMRDFYVDLPGFWETLKYYQVRSEKVSPIYQTTNAPAVLVVGDAEAHNALVRLFSEMGITSQRAILVQGNQRVDSYSLEELKEFALVVLYRYQYRSGEKTWEMLDKYVRGGGSLFIDTGDERPEAAVSQLPSLFPISSNERETLGTEWDLELLPILTEWGIDVGKFTAPMFDEEPWSFSYAEPEAVDGGTEVILKNHGKVILAQAPLGSGQVIWSGMNLPYHIQREHNPEELLLFEKLLLKSVSAAGDSLVAETDFERPSPQKVIIKGEKGKAALFKEADYEGWRAVLSSVQGRKRLKIYQAGPMQPGYMYVIIPSEFRNKPYQVTFTFWGSWKIWVYYLINFAGILLIIDLITGKHGLRLLNTLSLPLRGKFEKWWERDEEY